MLQCDLALLCFMYGDIPVHLSVARLHMDNQAVLQRRITDHLYCVNVIALAFWQVLLLDLLNDLLYLALALVVELVADCSNMEIKLITDMVLSLKSSLRRLRLDDPT